MTNDETMIMLPENGDQTVNSQSVNPQPAPSAIPQPQPQPKKSSNAGTILAAGGAAGVAAAMGGVVGAAGAAAAIHAYEESQAEDKEDIAAEEDNSADDINLVAQAPQPQSHSHSATSHSSHRVSTDANGELDYTGNAGADPVATPHTSHTTEQHHTATTPVSNNDGGSTDGSDDVQILGVYQTTDDDGGKQEWAVVTDGNEVGAIIDVDNNGTADALWVDENNNQKVEENEVYDITDKNIAMNEIEQQYVAQQQTAGDGSGQGTTTGSEDQNTYENQYQQDDTFAYNASEDYHDYNNNADVYDA